MTYIFYYCNSKMIAVTDIFYHLVLFSAKKHRCLACQMLNYYCCAILINSSRHCIHRLFTSFPKPICLKYRGFLASQKNPLKHSVKYCTFILPTRTFFLTELLLNFFFYFSYSFSFCHFTVILKSLLYIILRLVLQPLHLCKLYQLM